MKKSQPFSNKNKRPLKEYGNIYIKTPKKRPSVSADQPEQPRQEFLCWFVFSISILVLFFLSLLCSALSFFYKLLVPHSSSNSTVVYSSSSSSSTVMVVMCVPRGTMLSVHKGGGGG